MLDLSVLTTEECAYLRCEGGLTCAATHRCVARKTKLVGLVAARLPSSSTVSVRLRTTGTGTDRRDAVVSMTQAQQRYSSHKTVNPVRQCARRVSELEVAQASPLFSDHAPR